MRAVVLSRIGSPPSVMDRPEPKPASGEVEIRVRACGLCRTDLHVIDGELPNPKLPLIPGHQIIGDIVKVGADVTGLSVGDRVGVPWLGFACGMCEFCRRGEENLCDNALFTGYTRDGGLAEFTVADSRFCLHMPAGLGDVEHAPLLCAGLIGYRSLMLADKQAERLGVFGFGSAAHLITQVARHQGRDIYAFTRPGDTATQAFALAMGAKWAGGSNQAPPVPLDAAIIFAPAGELVPVALQAIRKGGSVVCGGIHMSDIPSFAYHLLWGERTLRSVANLTRRDGEEFLRLAAEVGLKPHSEVFALDDTVRALDQLRHGKIRGSAVVAM